MKKRFFFNGIDMHRAGRGIDKAVECTGSVFLVAAKAPLKVRNDAFFRAYGAFNLFVIKLFVKHDLPDLSLCGSWCCLSVPRGTEEGGRCKRRQVPERAGACGKPGKKGAPGYRVFGFHGLQRYCLYGFAGSAAEPPLRGG
jgi:hypothetical protein